MKTPTGGRLRNQLVKSTLGTLGFRVSGALGGVLSARLLAPSGRGQYAVLVVVATAVGMIATAGLQFWVAVEVARPAGAPVATVIRRHMRIATAALLPAVAVALVIAPRLGLASVPEVLAAALLAFATIWSMIELAVPNGMLHMGAVALITTVSGMSYLVWMVVGLVVGVHNAAFVVAGAAVANMAMVPLARRHRRWLPATATEPVAADAYSRAVRFGLPASAGELLTLATFRLDLLLVAAFLTRAQVGLYAVALALSELLWVLPDGVAQVLLPHVARRRERNGTGALVTLSCLVMLAGGAVLVVFARPLIAMVFGTPYADAAKALPALVVAAVAMGAWKMLGADVVASGNSRARAWSALVGLVTMVAMDVVLIPHLGISGAAVGSAIAYGAAAVHMWGSRRRVSIIGEPVRRDETVLAVTS